jgi:hypothetical protein
VSRGSGGNEAIHDREFHAGPFRLTLQPPPTERRIQIDLQYPPGKAFTQVEVDPRL